MGCWRATRTKTPNWLGRPLPSRLVPAVTSRFKILEDLDIAERRQAQDGRIRRKYRDRVIDFRVNTLPSRFGEKVCLRLLESTHIDARAPDDRGGGRNRGIHPSGDVPADVHFV